MRIMVTACAMALVSCGGAPTSGENGAEAPAPAPVDVVEPAPPRPTVDDLPPPFSEADYQVYPASEIGLDEQSSYSDIVEALEIRFRRGARIMGNITPRSGSTQYGDQLVTYLTISDGDDPTYAIRQFVVFSDNPAGQERPIARTLGIRQVCRSAEVPVWTTAYCSG